VKIILYKGHDKYGMFVTQLHAIKQKLRETCDRQGIELHGTTYTFKLVLGGDLAFHGGAFGRAGAASTFFCFVCDMARHEKHLTPFDYPRKGMTPPMYKISDFAAMLTHALGEEYGLAKPCLCPRCGLRVKLHGDMPPFDGKHGRQDY
jgi:hypothetical protein